MSGQMNEIPGGDFRLNEDERDLIRSLILAEPSIVLDDPQVMRVLIGHTGEKTRKVVDLRDRLVERMETRLAKLIRTNRSVIAAAYETVAGTSHLHDAVLALLDAPDLAAFLRVLTVETPQLVGTDEARLCLEAEIEAPRPAEELAGGMDGRVLLVPEGTVHEYLALEGEASEGGVLLRQIGEEAAVIYGTPCRIRSEACLRLTLGASTALLAFGSADPDRFGPEQGPELLHFFGGIVERLALGHLQAEAGAQA